MILTSLHYLYIITVVIILGIMLLKKDIVIPSIIGIFLMGLFYSNGNFVKSIQGIYNSLIFSGNEFWGIIVIISLVVSMSKSLQAIGADILFMSPIKKIMFNKDFAFWGIGITMLLISWLVWPSPSVPLVAAVLLPAAVKVGLPVIYVAVAMNLFGHGVGLSSDFFIQGAPAITASSMGKETSEILFSSIPIWLVMSLVTIITAFFMMKKDLKKNIYSLDSTTDENKEINIKFSFKSKLLAIFTPLIFLFDIFAMIKFNLTGGDATALVGGSAIFIMLLATVSKGKLKDSFELVVDYIKEGFGFGIKIFSPVIFIAGFFFLGNQGGAEAILGAGAPDILTDISIFLSENVKITKFSAILTEVAVAIISGLDGSGFSGLPITGSLAHTFSNLISINESGLAAVGQIVTIWVGGGTIIPWAVIPVAAVCGINPADLARKNLIPVLCGILAVIIFSFITL